jgi:hypothetical protein
MVPLLQFSAAGGCSRASRIFVEGRIDRPHVEDDVSQGLKHGDSEGVLKVKFSGGDSFRHLTLSVWYGVCECGCELPESVFLDQEIEILIPGGATECFNECRGDRVLVPVKIRGKRDRDC